MHATLSQVSFLGGEISQVAQGRFDLPTYRISLNVCLNSLPTETGSWTRRPGFQYGNHSRGGVAARAITWTFKENAPYTTEWTDGFVRFHSGTHLSTTNDDQTIVAISSANPAVVQTSGSTTWQTGDTVKLINLGTPDPLLINRQFVITSVDSTHFSIADAITNANIDGSTLATFTSGTVEHIQELGTPYDITLWPTIRLVQAETQAVVLQTSVPPQVMVATPPDDNDAQFTIAPAQFIDGPYLDPVVGATITPASVTGIVGFTMQSLTWSSTAAYSDGDYVVKSGQAYQSLIDQNVDLDPSSNAFAWATVNQDVVIGDGGLQPSDIGRHIRMLSEPNDWASGTTYSEGDFVKSNLQYWSSLVGSNTGVVPGSDETKWQIASNATRWTWGKIVSLTGAEASLINPSTGTAFTGGGTFLFPARAFDGVLFKPYTACAFKIGGSNPLASTDFSIGKHYSSGAEAVSYVIINAPTNRPFVNWFSTVGTLTLNLRGKSSSPASPSDGTLLGTANARNIWNESIQIFSNDAATTWNFLWVEMSASTTLLNIFVSQVQFFQALSFSGTGISVQLLGPDLQYVSTAIRTWRLGLFNLTDGFPTCGTYHEGRLWISGIVDNRLDASALTDIFDNPASTLFYFTPTIQDGTVSADCAISYKLDGPDVNSIFWMEPDHQGILVGTQAGEWLVEASTLNSPLAPDNMQAHRVTKIGCANIEPRRTDHTVVFTQKDQRKIMEDFADIFSGKFSAPNLSKNAAHLTARGIEELAYQNGTTPYIWARCADGSLIGAAYSRDSLMQSQGPTFIAFHQHALGSGRIVESIAVGPAAASASNPAGSIDTLAIVSNDTNTNIRHIEYMTPLFIETDNEIDAFFADDAITPTVVKDVTVLGQLGVNLFGLWHLNGKTVMAFLAGINCGNFTVSNGAIFVPYGANALFTQTLADSLNPMPAVVGFDYNSDAQIVRPATPQESGSRTGPALGKKRRASQYSFHAIASQGLQVGTTFSRLTDVDFRTPGNVPYAENVLFTGIHWDSLKDDWGFDSMLCWRGSGGYPATIAALSLFLETSDK